MTVHTIDDVVGNEFEFEVDERPRYSQGSAVFFTTDKKYAISFYPEASVKNVSVKRLQNIIYQLPKKIFAPPGGGFYRNIFAWPEFLVNAGKKLAFVTPFYPPNFFFRPDPGGAPRSPLAGSPKEPHWYASPVNAQTLVPKGERGTFLGLLNVCLNLCRGIGRLHEFRLLPGDLSFHSFLAATVSGGVLIRQIAHLITPEHPGYRIYESLDLYFLYQNTENHSVGFMLHVGKCSKQASFAYMKTEKRVV